MSRRTFRGGALASVALLLFAVTSVLYHVTDVVGGGESVTYLLVVGATLLVATVLARYLRPPVAVGLTLLFLAVGCAAYFLSLPEVQRASFSLDRILADVVALLTGLSVLRLAQADVWALAATPAPVFFTWYLALRRRYVGAATVGGATLGLLVLTGDADPLTTLAGVVGVAGAVGLGTLEARDGVTAQLDTFAIVVAAMIVASASLSVVPGGAAQPLLPETGAPTSEQNLVQSSDEVDIAGSIRLSPKVRFTVRSAESSYWRTSVYDRYTGSGWVRSESETSEYDGRLESGPGERRELTQRVTAETRLQSMPAAAEPVELRGEPADSALVTEQGTLRAGGGVRTNESYAVVSELPQYTPEQLRRSGDDYPDEVDERYLQLPDSTSDRLRERTANVTEDENNSYDKAVAIEEHLESTKGYSLTVDEPSGDVADEFLFEMDAGYCTYFASTMAVMLRSEGIPARMATGYTPGQQVGENEWVVRGLNAHAWVEVYFPEVGWVQFDPTPSSPREAAEDIRLESARQSNESDVDTGNSSQGEWTPTPTETPDDDDDTETDTDDESTSTSTSASSSLETDDPQAEQAGDNASLPGGAVSGLGENQTTAPPPNESGGGDGGTDDSGSGLPDTETIGVGLVALVGLAAGARRTGVSARAYRTVWVRYQGRRRTPERDAERAFERLEYLLSRRYRSRRPGETPRRYLRSLSRIGLDERALRVGDVYERARYGGGVSREDADAAIDAVDSLVREGTPLLGRFRS
ncbi:transglutaminaseTgpA domain-containing protein [Haloprofundus halobius]|uniref:transglutaminase family protein n=1 Tax=Haloprofundus halobius TaxID=2876194 RepID=UPI001CCFB887|nr:transglutaminaseTgpA domain-containing protein [Haloprofundus halobius]